MKAFVGLCFAMGILKLPKRAQYWRSSKWLFSTEFGSIMPRDRFDLLWRYLHLQDNKDTSINKSDKLWKLRWFIDHLNARFQSVYSFGENCTIDESMVRFKGRLSFRQYLPAKPIKWGIKIWTLCGSTTGYAAKMQIYTGKVEGKEEKGLSHRVCMDLLRPWMGTWIHCYMDNFYSSPTLFTDLRQRGILACGTVRANRKGLPSDFKGKKKMARGEFSVAQKETLICSVWQDTKVVQTLSSFHSPLSPLALSPVDMEGPERR